LEDSGEGFHNSWLFGSPGLEEATQRAPNRKSGPSQIANFAGRGSDQRPLGNGTERSECMSGAR